MTATGCQVNQMRLECTALQMAQELAEIASDVELMVRELRPHLDADSPPWVRNQWALARGIQRRLESHLPPQILEPTVSVTEDDGAAGL